MSDRIHGCIFSDVPFLIALVLAAQLEPTSM